MKVTRVDHIGIAVKNLDEMVKWYEETRGLVAIAVLPNRILLGLPEQ